jgi:hypothetical protein
METRVHVHNGVLVKIPIWTKLPCLDLSVLLVEYPEEVFETGRIVRG